MSFEFRPAKRDNVPLLIGLAGGTGSGKTYSAMQLAKGLAGGKRFAVIDTEAGRAKHYAEEFEFDHADLKPPFRPEAYAAAITAAEAAGFPVIVVDSASHEHAGEGGLLDWHEEELQRLAGDDWKKREAMTFTAWIKPKGSHKKFVNRLLQLRAHLILCFRAEEKIEIVKENGKTVVRPKKSLTGAAGWIPVSEKNLPYELTLSFLLTAAAPGVPRPIKLQEQHRPFFPEDQPISERAGAELAAWAAGGAPLEREASASADEPIEWNADGVAASGEAEELAEQLLAFAEQTGKRTAVQGAITKNRAEHLATPDAHVAWLRKQLDRAKDAAGGESEFVRLAREAQERRSPEESLSAP